MDNINSNQISTYVNKLYEHMKAGCENEEHSSRAIYYCIHTDCNSRYVCSECIIEDSSHLNSHKIYFLPLDNKLKFLKFMDLSQIEVFDTDKRFKDHKKNRNNKIIENFYSKLKESILLTIEEHKIKNLESFEHLISENESQTDKNSSLSASNKIIIEIENFIKSNRKWEIKNLYEKLNDIINVNVAEENENVLQDLNKDLIRSRINDLITTIINPSKNYLIETKIEESTYQPTLTFSQIDEPETSQTNNMIERSERSNKKYNNLYESFIIDNSSLNSEYEDSKNRSANIKNKLEELRIRLQCHK